VQVGFLEKGTAFLISIEINRSLIALICYLRLLVAKSNVPAMLDQISFLRANLCAAINEVLCCLAVTHMLDSASFNGK
jgi:hypothetical protein